MKILLSWRLRKTGLDFSFVNVTVPVTVPDLFLNGGNLSSYDYFKPARICLKT